MVVLPNQAYLSNVATMIIRMPNQIISAAGDSRRAELKHKIVLDRETFLKISKYQLITCLSRTRTE
jgi:hypothetical protein